MHPRNKMRLLAGLTIDHSLEVTEAREIPNRRDVAPANEKNLTKKTKDLTKACQHLENAVKALEAAPATDTNAEIPQIIKDIEELIDDLCGIKDKTSKIKPIKEAHVDHNKDKKVKYKGKEYLIVGSGKGEGPDETYSLKCCSNGETIKVKAKDLKDNINEMDISFDTRSDSAEVSSPNDMQQSDSTPSASGDFVEGDVVFYDNGVWVVFKYDKSAAKVGIIPPDLHGKEEEECVKAMQMVDPGKIRRPNNAESSILKSGPDNKLGTEDDMFEACGMKHKKEQEEKTGNKAEICPKCGCNIKHPKKGCKCTYKHKMNESTLNYNSNSNANSFNFKEVPINVVNQGEDDWKTDDRNEAPYQSKDLYKLNGTEQQQVKIPSSIKSELKSVIDELEKEANKNSHGGHTANENQQLFRDTANALQELLDHLDGTLYGMQKAQIHASSLMGPMQTKIPAKVWKFIVNGGQQRSLKDYVINVKQ